MFQTYLLSLVQKIQSRGRLLLKGGEDDKNGPSNIVPSSSSSEEIQKGPMTRARTRQITEQMNLLLEKYFSHDENWVLPNASTFCVLKFSGEESSMEN